MPERPLAQGFRQYLADLLNGTLNGCTSAVQLDSGRGWHAVELSGSSQWRWSNGVGQILVNNTTSTPLSLSLRLMLEGLHRGDRASVLHRRARPLLQ